MDVNEEVKLFFYYFFFFWGVGGGRKDVNEILKN